MPTLTMIAGPNGSGKSTYAQAVHLESIDPDRIAAGYDLGFTPEANLRASREALTLMQLCLKEGHSFAVETTLAGRQPLRLMDQAIKAGYNVHLAVILANADEDTRLRIENRVLQGGHSISDQDLKRREPRILKNVPDALQRANVTAVYVSSVLRRDFVLVGAMLGSQCQLTSELPPSWLKAISELVEISGSFEVQQVRAINQHHPITAYFPAHVPQEPEC
jgi:predicted ABC-type ATPase